MADSAVPEVSIVMPAFNAAGTLKEAVDSVLAQGFTDWELIIVNDKSTDNTAALASDYANRDPRIQLLDKSINQGPSVARNDAIEMARGRWIALLDSDDMFDSSRLLKLLDVANDRGVDFVADNVLRFDPESGDRRLLVSERDDRPYRSVSLESFVNRNVDILRIRRSGYGLLKPLMRRSFLQDHNIRYDPSIRLGEDYLFYLSALLADGRFVFLNEPLYLYRNSAESLSKRQNARHYEELAQAELRCLTNAQATSAQHKVVQRHVTYCRRMAAALDFLSLLRKGPMSGVTTVLQKPDMNFLFTFRLISVLLLRRFVRL